MSLHLSKAMLGMVITLPEHVFERHLPSSPEVVGEELATQVMEYVRRHRLGYYPPLDYFNEHGGLDTDALEAAGHIGWFVSNLVRDEVRRRLRPLFSSFSIVSIQPLAYTMPPVRPNHPNAAYELARHYTPDTVKLSAEVSTFQKRADPEAMADWAKHLAYRWLKDKFAHFEVTSARSLD